MASYVMPRIHFRQSSDGQPMPINPKSHYDRTSDTYFVFLYGAPEPSISLDVTDTMYALLDPETEDLIGIQIEAFQQKYVPAHPWVAPLLDRFGKASADEDTENSDAEIASHHRAIANYMVGALMTEGSLATV